MSLNTCKVFKPYKVYSLPTKHEITNNKQMSEKNLPNIWKVNNTLLNRGQGAYHSDIWIFLNLMKKHIKIWGMQVK